MCVCEVKSLVGSCWVAMFIELLILLLGLAKKSSGVSVSSSSMCSSANVVSNFLHSIVTIMKIS